ncbi:MAG: CRTAC1 family protein, partial [Flavobacteriales bacterium]
LVGVLKLSHAQEFIPWSYGNSIGNSYGADDYGCGVSIADINLDGKDDFTLINAYGPCRAYITGDGAIQVINLPFSAQDEVRQITWVDFDNDGDRDLCMTGRNMAAKLYRNSDMVFQDVSEELGIFTEFHAYYGHAWADYDRDGDLDVFVANYDQGYAGLTNFRNCLYRQNSNGHFDEVAEELGLVTEVNYTFMGLWTDINNDLWPDLFITNDRNTSPNDLFLNNGDGTFTEISASANMDDMILAMTATQGDYNNDGLLDYYITNNPSGNLHKQNMGDNTFLDIAETVGTQLNLFSWSAQFTDFDCDGLEDLHVCVSPHINYPHQNQLLKNIGDFFIPFTEESGIFPDNGWSRGSAVGDINDDGFQDIIVSKSYPSQSTFWLSVPNENHWLKVSLQGALSNKDGIGSWITCHKGNQIFSRYTNCGESYLAQNSFVEHFGLGEIDVLDSVVVRWTSGQRDVWQRVPTRQKLRLIEGSSVSARVQATTPSPECIEMSQEFSAVVSHGDILWMNGDSSASTYANTDDWVHFVWTDSLGNLFYSDSIQVSLDTSILSVSLNQPTCNNEQLGSAVLTFNDSIWSLPLLLNDSLVSASHLDSLGSGLYIASIVSPNNCSHTVSFSVDTVYRPIHQISWVINEPSCYGSSDGNIEFSFNAPDSIQWTYLDSSIQPDLLTAGQYNILIWNSSCYDTLSVEIFQPDELAINMVIGPDENSGNYSISLEATGGITPYTYFIDQIEINGDMALNVMPGSHVIQAMDNHQCIIDSSIYLDFPVSVSSMNIHILHFHNDKSP